MHSLLAMNHRREGAQPDEREATSPILELRAEHDVMLQVLMAMTRALEQGGRLWDEAFWRDVLELLESYGERHHHMKEEIVLFPKLAARGLDGNDGPLRSIAAEHEQARALLRVLATGVRKLPTASIVERGDFRRVARAYCELAALHIERENGVLLPLADRILTADDRREILQRFRLLDGESAVDRARFLALVNRLRNAA
jgi:hemerythrin-like domain-containing protein